MRIKLRFATEQDAGACAAIYRPYVEKTSVTFEYDPPGREEMARRMAAYGTQFPWIVAESGGQLVGYAYACAHHERAAYQWNADLAVYLREDIRAKGIGRRLYGCPLELLAMQGYCRAIGVVTCPNPASEALHKALGFSTVAVWPHAGYKLGEWHGVQWFTKELAPFTDHPRPPVPVAQLDPQKVRALFEQYGERD